MTQQAGSANATFYASAGLTLLGGMGIHFELASEASAGTSAECSCFLCI